MITIFYKYRIGLIGMCCSMLFAQTSSSHFKIEKDQAAQETISELVEEFQVQEM